MENQPATMSVTEWSAELRARVEEVKMDVHVFAGHLKNREVDSKEDKGEQIANAMLAYRHLEDAKMRLGKVIQATEGVSVYDTPAK